MFIRTRFPKTRRRARSATCRAIELPIGIEIFRGRYVHSFAQPAALSRARSIEYRWNLPNVDHVFLPGHRIMVQVQSSLFPLYDRNPQTFVPNIFYAKRADYRAATQQVFTAEAQLRARSSSDRPLGNTVWPRAVLPLNPVEEFKWPTTARSREKFLGAELKASPFIMLGVEGTRDGATQPMTVQFEDQDREAGAALDLHRERPRLRPRAMGQVKPSHRLLFRPRGTVSSRASAGLSRSSTTRDDRPAVESRSSPNGTRARIDPKLALVRSTWTNAKIWKSDVEGFLKPAFNKLLGRKPEAGMKEKVAEVSFYQPSAVAWSSGVLCIRCPSASLKTTKATRPNAALATWISQKVVVGRLE